jgi:hypothetical protein
MRIYILGNDGITLCREPPAAVNEGEIVVASNEKLHAARLSGKRLLALWNALPDVEKRKKVGDRDALVNELWSAIETLPEPQSDAKRPSKQDAVIAMLRRPEGQRWMRWRARRVGSGTPCAASSRELRRRSLGSPLLQPKRSAAASIASLSRSRHETRDPRRYGLPGGALAPPHSQHR